MRIILFHSILFDFSIFLSLFRVAFTFTKTNKLLPGGREAYLFEFPYAVLIGFYTENEIKYGCGGSLINQWYVLSAAHCFKERFPPVEPEEVRIGELNTLEDPDCDSSTCAPRVQIVSILNKKCRLYALRWNIRSENQY